MPVSLTKVPYAVADGVAVAVSCALVTAVTAVVTPDAWPSPLPMLLGMVGGMALSVPCVLVMLPFLGMIELMLKMMPACMFAGMAGSMLATHAPALEISGLLVVGASFGVGASLILAVLNVVIRASGGIDAA